METDNIDNKENIVAEDSFDTTGLLLAFLANWKWFVLSVFVCLVGAYFFIASRIPTYQVDASIYLSDDHNSGQNAFNLSSSTDPMVALKNYIDETELEVLKSRNNLIKIVDSLGLAYKYYAKSTFRNVPLYKDNAVTAKMDSIAIRQLRSAIRIEIESDGEGKYDIKASTKFNDIKEEKNLKKVTLPAEVQLSQGTVVLSQTPAIPALNGTEIITIENPRAAAAVLSQNLSIEFAKNSEKIMRVSLMTTNEECGIDIIDVLLDFYNRDIIEDKNRSAVQTEAFILDRLGMINGELKDVENRLKEYRQANKLTDIQAQSTLNLTLQSNYEQEVASIDADLRLFDEIQNIVSASDIYETLPSAVNNQTVTKVIEDYNLKIAQLNRALEGSTPDNPLIKNMQQQLSRDKVRILQNIETAKRGLIAQRNSIRKLENQSTGALASTPTIDKGFQEIFREQQVKVNIYTFLLQRREEIALQKTLATNTARLIDDPVGSAGPVSPKRMVIYMMGLLIGLAIPAAFIFIRRQLFPIFSDKEELERITKVPVLGEICRGDVKSEEEVVVGENVSTPVAELFRLLRNNISFTRSGVDSKVILITSSVSGEGKTFIATNLALTYALMGKKVLVVGMDLRRPMLAHRFGLNNQRGVTTFLSGQEHDVDKLIVQSKLNSNLYVLCAGPVPPNPNELLMSPNMTRLMSQLRSEFDYVLIDSAPIGVISDTFLILRHSDLQLYVTRANYSSKSSLKVLHDAVKNDKFSSVYLVLNGVNMTSNSYVYRRYGYYGHYGQSGRKNQTYGYGYISDKKKEEQ